MTLKDFNFESLSYFSVSIHSDYLIRHGCHKIMMDILHTQQLKGKQKWCPAVADVLTVFVNYGNIFVLACHY